MTHLFLKLLVLLSSAYAIPRLYVPFKPIVWRGKSVVHFQQLVEAVRSIETRAEAAALSKQVALTNPESEKILGYVLGELETPVERQKFEDLFGVEHPFLGTLSEAASLPESAKFLIGYLVAGQITEVKLRSVRKMLIALPADVSDHLQRLVFSREAPDAGELIDKIEAEYTSCARKLGD